MTDFVIDSNILMSVLISGKASYRPILSYYNFLLPDFALVEVEKYKHILKSKTRMQADEFLSWTYFVFSNITIFPQYILSGSSIDKTQLLLKNIDLKDTAFVALAMQMDLFLLTRDITLFKGLKKQGFRKVILFENFLKTI